MAPAMRVAVIQLGLGQQALVIAQGFQNFRIGFPNAQTSQRSFWQGQGFLQETAIVAHRVFNGQTVFFADIKVIDTMRWRGMHHAGTGIRCDVFTTDDGHILVIERMSHQHMFQCRTRTTTDHLAF